MNPDDILTLTQAAEQYPDRGVNRKQIERACKRGELATVTPKPTKRHRKQPNAGAPVKYRVRRAAFEAWLDLREIPDGYTRVDHAAEICKIKERVLYDAIKAGLVPSVKRNYRYGQHPRIYVKVDDVENWRDSRGVRAYRTSA